MLGDCQFRAATAAVHALVGQVVDGEQGWRTQPAPVHVGRCQAGGPVVGVHHFGLPVDPAFAGGDFGGGQAQAGEADVVVGPVAAVVGTIGCAVALVQFGADQHIDDQAVRHIHAPDLARRQGRVAAQFTDDVDGVVAFHHLAVAGDQYPYIMQVRQGTGQGSRHVTQATGFHQVGDFRGHEQNLALVAVVLALGAGCLACRGEVRGERFAVVRVE
ncbi:hypothetical protein D3C79_413530 [compost metagenome]